MSEPTAPEAPLSVLEPAEFGSDFGEAIAQLRQNEAQNQSVQASQSTQQQATIPTKEKGQEATEKPTHKIEISDDPFGGLEAEESQPTEKTGDEPDFEKELDEEVGKEPSGDKEKAAWGKLRTKAKSAMQRAYQLERSLALKEKEFNEKLSQVPSQESVSEWEKKYKDVINNNAIIALQEDQGFQQKVAQPYWAAKDFVDQAVSYFGLDRNALGEAMKVPGVFERTRKLAEVFDNTKGNDMLPEQRNQVMRALEQEASLEATFSKAQEEAVTLYEGAKQKQAQAQQQSYVQRQKSILEAVPSTFEKFSKLKDFKDVFNGSAKEIEQKVLKSLNGPEPSPDLMVGREIAAFSFKPLLAEVANLRKQLAERDEAIARYSNGGASPAAGSSPTGSDPKPTEEESLAVPAGSIFAGAMEQLNGGRRNWMG